MAYMARRPYSSTLGSLAHATVSMVSMAKIWRFLIQEFDEMLFAAFEVKVEIVEDDFKFTCYKFKHGCIYSKETKI
ncbi:hypothetical protein LXL04_009994 [Taraxacum kok-saghyz]